MRYANPADAVELQGVVFVRTDSYRTHVRSHVALVRGLFRVEPPGTGADVGPF